jgi:glycogen debranching enzyme
MNFIEVENKFYILATSSFADQRYMVLKEADTFGIFDHHGDIHKVGEGKQGIFHDGTRHVARMELNINGERPLLLSSSPREDNQMLSIDLTNPDIMMENGDHVQRGTIHILRSKFLWQSSYHERIELVNFGLDDVSMNIEIVCDADFADIFEVRGSVREKKGERLDTEYQAEQMVYAYRGLDKIIRSTRVRFTPAPNKLEKNRASFKVWLEPQEKMQIDIQMSFAKADKGSVVTDFESAKEAMNAFMKKASQYCADIITSNHRFNEWIARSKSDLITMTTKTPHGLYPYAGVPWYSTPFGRDGIITAMESLWVEPELAKGVLNYLSSTQAKDFNDFQDAEPGKIFHETRGGEMAELGEIPFKLYYGTIDATPLFICLAGNYLERTNDVQTIRNIWPNILLALEWIDKYGDIDEDGFVEYKTKSSKGLTNQGWKDSQDSVFHSDGTLAEEPIALCEVQGYVYDAKMKASQMAKVLGDHDLAAKLEIEAEELRENFNEKFWSEEKQTYVIALDGKKNQCEVLSSNAGHCLFSGIATPERAARLAKKLIGETMFSGWGIRTIATDEARYNPMSYHNGSIWPHDNAMIAQGFSRYNLMTEASKVMAATFDTAEHMESQRLPELFCGFERHQDKSPTLYPVACSPQAWSVGAVFMMMQACLGLRIDAARNTIILSKPVLPSFLREVTITNLRLNNKSIALQVRASNDGCSAFLLTPNSDIKIEVHNEEVLENVIVS